MAQNQDGMEKTEQATPKRLNEARERGQVAKSMDVTTAAILLVGCMSVFMFIGSISSNLLDLSRSVLLNISNITITQENIPYFFGKFALFLLKVIGPIVFLIFIVALVAEISQVGFKIATKKFTEGLRFKQILNPFQNLKRIFFSSYSLFELAKGLVKIIILGLVAYSVLRNKDKELVGLLQMPYNEIINFMFRISFELVWKMGVVYIAIAVGDFIFQKWKFKNDMKMTKQEVKEEWKQMEGDPLIKSRIRSMMQTRLRHIMLRNVPSADVILTNPTHFAVALKYEQKEMSAPKVIAKGVDYLALKIREIANENDIPIIENPPLARQIYYNVEVDQEIPQEFYQAVAQVLAYVYSLKEAVT